MFKIVNSGKLPTKGSKYSACVDVYANETIIIGAGETVMIGLGIAIDDELLVKSIPMKRYAMAFDETLHAESEQYYKDVIHNFMESHYLQLMLRSSLGKSGLMLPNGVGIIDLDYKDEIKMIIHNPIDYVTFHNEDYSQYTINKGDRIGQITLLEHKAYLFGIESEDERVGGFGSSGKN